MRGSRRITLRWRVTLWALALLGGAQLTFLGLASRALQARLRHDVQERAASRVDQVCALLVQEDQEEFQEAHRRVSDDSLNAQASTLNAPLTGAPGIERTAVFGPHPRAPLDGADEFLASPGALAAFAF